MANPIKIFLVDDQGIANFINKKLIEITGLTDDVQDFTDPQEALEAIAENNPDLVLLDLNMPLMSGWDFLNQMKSFKTSTKVAICTSSTSTFDKQRMQEYTMVIDYCEKPLNQDVLKNLAKTLKTNPVL
ncbi:MAG: response regulator [Cytophagaceae bacterium]|nr:response regulator [Cytophagaceae bacterium]|tara:strand:- start:1842 stop:2228 length:387 start_codon:yes stop_codon:yes gene_type:complete